MKRWIYLAVLIASAFLLSPESNGTSSKPPTVQGSKPTADYREDAQERHPPQMVDTPFEAEILETLRAIARQQQTARAEDIANDKRWWPPSPSWAIVYVTIVYVFVAIFQWCGIRRQATIANKMLLLQFRPKLIVRNVVIKIDNETPPPPLFQQGMPVLGQFYISNIGGTPATIIGIGCWVEWCQSLPMRRPYETKEPNSVPWFQWLEPSQSTPCDFDSAKEKRLMDRNASSILTGDFHWTLYIMGWVEYRDNLRTKRRTAFCRYWDYTTGRFTAVKDPDYEHEE